MYSHNLFFCSLLSHKHLFRLSPAVITSSPQAWTCLLALILLCLYRSLQTDLAHPKKLKWVVVVSCQPRGVGHFIYKSKAENKAQGYMLTCQTISNIEQRHAGLFPSPIFPSFTYHSVTGREVVSRERERGRERDRQRQRETTTQCGQ